MAGRSLTGRRKYAKTPNRIAETVSATVITGRRIKSSERFTTALLNSGRRCRPRFVGRQERRCQHVPCLLVGPTSGLPAPHVRWARVPRLPRLDLPDAVQASRDAAQPYRPISPRIQTDLSG